MRAAILVLAAAVAGCAMRPTLDEVDAKRREAYLERHPELNTEDRDRIRHGRAWIGMTAEQLSISYGGPDRRHRLVSADKTTEEWVYVRPAYTVRFFVDEGVVSSWQTSE